MTSATNKILQRIFAIAVLAGLGGFLIPRPLRAAEIITASPAVFDFKAKARDILPEKIILTNKSDVKLNVYTFVNNILATTGEAKFWIAVSIILLLWPIGFQFRGVLELARARKRN